MREVSGNKIAQILDISDSRIKYDASARKLVSQKAILAYILKSTMDEFSSVTVKQIAEELIEGSPQVSEAAVNQDSPDLMSDGGVLMDGNDGIHGMMTEDVSVREGTVRYDIRFAVRIPSSDECIEIIVNIEIQNKDMPGYPIPKRGIYYGSRLISAQRGSVFKNQEYGKIKKVVSIWICENTSLSRSDTINEYRFSEVCKRGNYQEESKNYDLMRVIVMRLGAYGEDSEDDAIRLLSMVFSSERSPEYKKMVLSEEFQINVTEEISQEVRQMCNLSTGILEKGIEKGRAEGRAEGMMETLFNLVREGVLTASVAAQQANMELAEFERAYRAYCEDK